MPAAADGPLIDTSARRGETRRYSDPLAVSGGPPVVVADVPNCGIQMLPGTWTVLHDVAADGCFLNERASWHTRRVELTLLVNWPVGGDPR